MTWCDVLLDALTIAWNNVRWRRAERAADQDFWQALRRLERRHT